MAATIEARETRARRRALIINADDFGMSYGINRGIMEAFAAGAVTSASLMVGMPASGDGMQMARSAGPALGVGLHLTLTLGRPLTPAPSLIDHATGEFLPFAKLLGRALSGGIRTADVLAECRAQIDSARRAGLTLTHLDGHQHVHLLPGVRSAVRQAVIIERIPAIRRPAEPLFRSPRSTRRLPQRAVIRLLSWQAHLSGWPVHTTDHFVGAALLGAPDFESRLIAILDQLPTGTTELMVHPGHASPPPPPDPYVSERETELRALLSPGVLARLRSDHIQLMHFGNLPP